MSEQRRLIGRQAHETPTSEQRSRPGRARRLPPDLLRQASRRLEIVSLLAVALWISTSVLEHVALGFSRPGDVGWMMLGAPDGVALAGVVVSLALYFYIHRGDRDPERIIDIGLAYMVLTAFAVGVPGMDTSPVIGWTGPVLLMAAAVVPAPTRKFAIAGFIAASMDPLGMMLVYPSVGIGGAILMHSPTYLLLGVATVISTVVT